MVNTTELENKTNKQLEIYKLLRFGFIHFSRHMMLGILHESQRSQSVIVLKDMNRSLNFETAHK